MYCIVCGYYRGRGPVKDEKISFHKFPLPGRGPYKQWLEFVHLPPDTDVSTLALCSKHFKPGEITCRNSKSRVCHGGVPSLLPPPSAPIIKVFHQFHNAEEELSETSKIKEEVQHLRSFTSNYNETDQIQTSNGNENLQNVPSSHTAYDITISDPLQCLAVIYENASSARREECGANEEENEEIVNQKAVFEAMQELCRICGKRGTGLVPIIGISSDDIPLSEKIQTYLNLQLSVDNSLSPKICPDCLSLLESWHKLFITCAAADAVFNNLLNGSKEQTVSAEQEVEWWNRNDESGDTIISDNTALKYCCPSIEEDGEALIEHFKDTTENIQNQCSYKLCPWCPETFLRVSELREHKEKCRELPGLCEYCGFTASKILIKRHNCMFRPNVENTVPYVCDKCGKAFGNERNVKRHLKTAHGEKITICYECNMEFSTEKLLLEHTFSHGREPEFYCGVCYEVFTKHMDLKSHKKNHDKLSTAKFEGSEVEKCNDSFICKLCGLLFPTLVSLVVHLNTPKESKCPQCPKNMRNERLLLKHQNNCSRRVCRFCSQCFSTAEVCRNHEHRHTGLKMYQCETCYKPFSSKSYLAQHRRVMHSSKLHSCKDCGQQFKWYKTLHRHRQRQCQPPGVRQGVGRKCGVEKKPNDVPELLPIV